MFSVGRIMLLLCLATAIASQPLGALAAPVGWESVSVTRQSENGQATLIVSGRLPAQARLPYETELAVPAGTQLLWIGEILGGDPAADPKLQYVKSSVNGMDVYRFTLTQARIGQVEGTAPDTVTFDGANYVSSLKWTPWTAIPRLYLSERIPQGSRIVQSSDGAATQAGPQGFIDYTKTIAPAKAGEVAELSFSYAPGSAAPLQASGGTGGSDNVALLLIATIVVLGLSLLVFGLQKKAGRRRNQDSVIDARPAQGHGGQGDAFEPESLASIGRHKKRVNLVVPTMVFIGLLVGGVMIASTQGTSAALIEGKISRDFGAPSACQSASLPLTAAQGVDLGRQGGQLMKAFEGMEGVGNVTLYPTESRIDLAWCESSQSEETMRGALTSTGLVTVGQASLSSSAVESATLDPSGKKQSIAVDTSAGTFAPNRITIQAGIPAEIDFGPAVGCLSEVVIDALDLRQDLTAGPTTIRLPALKAGTYDFACQMGHQSGQIIVR